MGETNVEIDKTFYKQQINAFHTSLFKNHFSKNKQK